MVSSGITPRAPDPAETGTCVYAVGGAIGLATTGRVESYHLASNTWTTLPSQPMPRQNLAAAAMQCPPGFTGSCVYAVGGNGSANTVLGTVEALDPPPAQPVKGQ
ncbi:hypothetical protein ACFV9E_38895 [Streptomyces sp. NPDC059835]|uniref:hypothetical protein n=1 Tax=Streptomyces sp. NPDC059835 TaxID=3346967 RepID=UPI003650546D